MKYQTRHSNLLIFRKLLFLPSSVILSHIHPLPPTYGSRRETKISMFASCYHQRVLRIIKLFDAPLLWTFIFQSWLKRFTNKSAVPQKGSILYCMWLEWLPPSTLSQYKFSTNYGHIIIFQPNRWRSWFESSNYKIIRDTRHSPSRCTRILRAECFTARNKLITDVKVNTRSPR